MSLDRRYIKFFELCNERDFYERHEVLEDLWLDTSGEQRAYYQGLIQTATAFYHLENGNRGGARKLLKTGLNYLKPYPDAFLGFDLGNYRRLCNLWLDRVTPGADGDEAAIDTEDFPVLDVPSG